MGKRGPKPGTGGRPKGSGAGPRRKAEKPQKLPPGIVRVKKPRKAAVKPPGSVDYSKMEILPPRGFEDAGELEPGVKKRKRPAIKHTGPQLSFTPAQRRIVAELALCGLPRHMICEHIINPETQAPITTGTLDLYFGNELREGRRIANGALAKSVYHSAVGTPAEFDKAGNCIRAERAPNVTLLMFLSRVRLGYSWNGGMMGDRDPTVPVEPDGPTDAELVSLLEQVSDDELRVIRKALTKALPAPGR